MLGMSLFDLRVTAHAPKLCCFKGYYVHLSVKRCSNRYVAEIIFTTSQPKTRAERTAGSKGCFVIKERVD